MDGPVALCGRLEASGGGVRTGIPPPEVGVDQATVQAAPLRVNEVGLPALPVWVAWKPMLTGRQGKKRRGGGGLDGGSLRGPQTAWPPDVLVDRHDWTINAVVVGDP